MVNETRGVGQRLRHSLDEAFSSEDESRAMRSPIVDFEMNKNKTPLMQPKPVSRRVVVLSLLAVLAMTGAERAWLASRPGTIAEDGVLLLWRARDVEVPAIRATVTDALHPGYPAAVAAVKRGLLRGAEDDVEGWVLAGKIVAWLGAMVTVAGVWTFALLVFGDVWVATAGALLFGLGRKFAALGADVLNDSTWLALGVWASVAAVLVGRMLAGRDRRALPAAAAVGLLGGAAFWVRPEGPVVVLVALTVWLVLRLAGRGSWGRTLLAMGVAMMTASFCGGGLLWLQGGWSGKWQASEFFGSFGGAGGVMLAMLGQVYPVDDPAALKLLGRSFEAQHPLVGVLVCGYVLCWALGRLPRLRGRSGWLPGGGVCGVSVLVATWVWVVPPVVLRYLQTGAMSHRYLMLPACLSAGLAGALVVGLGRVTQRVLARASRPGLGRAAGPLLLAGLSAGLVFHAARPLHAREQYLKAAGQWMRSRDPGARVLTDSVMVLFYSQSHRGRVIFGSSETLRAMGREAYVRQVLGQYGPYGFAAFHGRPGEPESVPDAELLRQGGYEDVRSFDRARGEGREPKEALHVFRRGG